MHYGILVGKRDALGCDDRGMSLVVMVVGDEECCDYNWFGGRPFILFGGASFLLQHLSA